MSIGGQAECSDQGCRSHRGALLAKSVCQGEEKALTLDGVALKSHLPLSVHSSLLNYEVAWYLRLCPFILQWWMWSLNEVTDLWMLLFRRLCPALTSAAWSATLEPEVEHQLEHLLLELLLLVVTLQVTGKTVVEIVKHVSGGWLDIQMQIGYTWMIKWSVIPTLHFSKFRGKTFFHL